MGARTFEVDCVWRKARLIVELDGRRSHLNRSRFESDRERDELLSAAGWRVIRVTWRRLETAPTELFISLRRLLRIASLCDRLHTPGGDANISSRYMELSHTAYVILGFLEARPRTGYEIKQTVEGSTRFFWAASYGQIYPELKRLADVGLAEAERDDAGARRRIRYRITAAGRKELHDWLAQPAEVYELRDEWLLKLFLSMRADPGTGERIMADTARRHADLHARLAEIEPRVAANSDPYQLAVLRCGIETNRWASEWWSRQLKRVEANDSKGSKRLMFNFLAELAVKRRKVIVVLALVFFPAAGALGAGVADKLDPYGADDPDTESVQASDKLEAAGYRDAGVIVLVRDSRRDLKRGPRACRSADGSDQGATPTSRRSTGTPTLIHAHSYRRTASRPTSRSASPRPRTMPIQDQVGPIVDSLADDPNVLVGGSASRSSRSTSRPRRTCSGPSSSLSRCCSCSHFVFFRSLVAAALPVIVGAMAVFGTFLLLGSQPRSPRSRSSPSTSRPGWDWGCRSTTASSSSPDTARRSPGAAPARGARAHAADGRPHRPLLLAHRRAALAALIDLPAAFLFSMGMGGTSSP